MAPELPADLARKSDRFPEYSYGATRVTLVLADGRRVDDVFLSGSLIVKIGDRLISDADELNFALADLIDVKCYDRPVLAALRSAWRQWVKANCVRL